MTILNQLAQRLFRVRARKGATSPPRPLAQSRRPVLEVEVLEDRVCLTGYPGAIWDPASAANYTAASRTANDINWIVLHTTEGSIGGTRSWFKNPAAQASANYVIGFDGTIYQMVDDRNIAWHAGNWPYNQHAIGIEHERYGNNNVTPAEYQASAHLVQWLVSQYHVSLAFPSGVAPANPANGSGIIGHIQVPDPANPARGGGADHHTDPVNWDYNYYLSLFTPPPNDNFANRITLSGSSVSTTGTNLMATKEVGEPDHIAGELGGKSVWWSWTAPAAGSVTIRTTGSSFDTLLAVYTGTSVSALTVVAANDDEIPGSVLTSLVTFNVAAGQTYQIEVDGWHGENGSIVLSAVLTAIPAAPTGVAASQGTIVDRVRVTWNASPGATAYEVWRNTSDSSASATQLAGNVSSTSYDDTLATPGTTFYYWVKAKNSAGVSGFSASDSGYLPVPAPVNDNFANRITLDGTSVTVTGTNVGATREPGEPDHAGEWGGKSVWWTWTAPTPGTVTIDTRGSDFNTLLGVYTGTAVSDLTEVASNNDEVPDGVLTSLVTFDVVAGQTYQIAVDGWHGDNGAITLNLSLVTPPPAIVDNLIVNDGSAQRSMVTSLTVTFSGIVTFDPGAFELRRTDHGLIPLAVTTSVVGDQTVAVITFTGSDIIGGSLPDGNYVLTVGADKVHDSYGQGLSADYVTTFSRLFGDSNGNGVVGLQDLLRFASTLGKREGDGGYLAYFDYNGDGRVDVGDFVQLLRRFGRRL
jgi:hypothetical protein